MGAGERRGKHVTVMHKNGTDVDVSAQRQHVMQPSLTPAENQAVRQKVGFAIRDKLKILKKLFIYC